MFLVTTFLMTHTCLITSYLSRQAVSAFLKAEGLNLKLKKRIPGLNDTINHRDSGRRWTQEHLPAAKFPRRTTALTAGPSSEMSSANSRQACSKTLILMSSKYVRLSYIVCFALFLCSLLPSLSLWISVLVLHFQPHKKWDFPDFQNAYSLLLVPVCCHQFLSALNWNFQMLTRQQNVLSVNLSPAKLKRQWRFSLHLQRKQWAQWDRTSSTEHFHRL